MKTNETLKLLDDKDLLDKIYHFSYHRCNTSFEAEDLCSDIVLAVISAIHKQEDIENFYAFVWTVARRVYADYCEKRNSKRQILGFEKDDNMLASKENEIEKFIEVSSERQQVSMIFREIAFLSKAYREVMVMFYIDRLKVQEIASRLKISETTVKQRLFSARNSVRKEVETMNERAYVLKPVRFYMIGTGSPGGNDPQVKAERMFSQNLIYLCKNKPKTAKELSIELCVPMPYIEEELEIQCRGENGEYGMLRKLDNGKYTVNIHLADYDEYDKANNIYEKHLPEFCEAIKNTLEQNKEKILSFPYLSEQKDPHFIMWSTINKIVWDFSKRINKVLAEKYFSDIALVKRPFYCSAIAYTDDRNPEFDSYGCDGIGANSVGGYKWVHVSNIYGKRAIKHFDCGHNLSLDPKLLMTIRAIGGISAKDLSENEKEIAAKAIECGYLRKKGDIIEPKIIVIDEKDSADFYNIFYHFNDGMGPIIEQIAAELAEFMKTHIPKHLMNEYHIYTELIAGTRILDKAIEECISEGLLSKPENRLSAQGVVMIVEK